jgi:hypothetical protein
MAIDLVTAEVMGALEHARVGARLLKGPVIAQWLYADGALREYGDTDVLVAPELEDEAEDVLRSLGFVASPGVGRPDPGVARNHIWFRGEEVVELHVTLPGLRADPALVWSELSAGTDAIEVARTAVPALSLPARLLHVALHAAQHGRAEERPIEDLRRALEQVGRSDWADAADMARRLDAQDAMLAGLCLAPGGTELAAALDLQPGDDRAVALRAASAPPMAMGLERLARGAGFSGRIRHVLRVLFPTPAFLRWWTPLAQRGPAGLVAAYAWRYVYLATHLPGALLQWARAGRRDA